MQKHYFTLGAGYPETVQTIIAESRERARAIMFSRFGQHWAFDYSAEQWQQARNDGFFKHAKYLPVIDETEMN